MPRRLGAALVGAALLPSSPLPAAAPAASAGGAPVHVVASNFRFCAASPCDAGDSAYVRTDSGSLVDNAINFVEVHPGDTVVWTYEDADCDSLVAGPLLTCPGHEVQFESGQAARGTVGTMFARQDGPQSLAWHVPLDAAPGDVIRYYCDLSDHWRLGVTGALVVR